MKVQTKRTRRLLRDAYQFAATNSIDPESRWGAVLFIGEPVLVACNSFPSSAAVVPERLKRRARTRYMESPICRLIYAAAKTGIPTEGAVIYAPWFARMACARAMILAGVSEVIGHQQAIERTPREWESEMELANHLLDECGVRRGYYDGDIGDVSILFNGDLWHP